MDAFNFPCLLKCSNEIYTKQNKFHHFPDLKDKVQTEYRSRMNKSTVSSAVPQTSFVDLH